MTSVINLKDTPLLYRYMDIAKYSVSVKETLEIEEAVGVNNRMALLEEITKISEGMYWGGCVFGDPMGDPGITYVGIKASSRDEASKMLEEDKDHGIHSPWAMWGSGGLFNQYKTGEFCYVVSWQGGSKYPAEFFLSYNGQSHIRLWEDIKQDWEEQHYVCVDCSHLNSEHHKLGCRVGRKFIDRKEVPGCLCSHGYKDSEYFKIAKEKSDE